MRDRAITTALVALAEHGIPVDVQELLIRGNPSQGIAPGGLQKAIEAIDAWREKVARFEAMQRS